jgi:hypothetical protein
VSSAGYGQLMDRMPEPGDLVPYSFTPQPGRCHKMVYSKQLQASHCRGEPAWKGIWKDRKGKSWYVEACGEHAPKSAGARSSDQEAIERSGTD